MGGEPSNRPTLFAKPINFIYVITEQQNVSNTSKTAMGSLIQLLM